MPKFKTKSALAADQAMLPDDLKSYITLIPNLRGHLKFHNHLCDRSTKYQTRDVTRLICYFDLDDNMGFNTKRVNVAYRASKYRALLAQPVHHGEEKTRTLMEGFLAGCEEREAVPEEFEKREAFLNMWFEVEVEGEQSQELNSREKKLLKENLRQVIEGVSPAARDIACPMQKHAHEAIESSWVLISKND